MVFTPVYRLEDRTVSAIMALEWDGPLTLVMQRDNPHQDEDSRERGVKNHLHQYQRGRELFLRGDHDALLVIEDDMIPPPDTLKRLAKLDTDIAYGVYMFRHGAHVVNILQRYYPWPTPSRNIGETLTSKPSLLKRARRKGVIDCSGSGFGCVLIKRHVIETVPFSQHHAGDRYHFDLPWVEEAYRYPYRMKADMNLLAGHIDEDGTVIWPSWKS